MSVKRHAIVAFLIAPGLTGCGTASGVPTPLAASSATARPVATPTPIKMNPGRAGAKSLVAEFDEAVVLHAMTIARGYLTASLAVRTPPMVLPSALGVQSSIPKRASATLVSFKPGRAVADATYYLAHGKARDRLTLVYNGRLWRISAIRHC